MTGQLAHNLDGSDDDLGDAFKIVSGSNKALFDRREARVRDFEQIASNAIPDPRVAKFDKASAAAGVD